MWLFANDFKYRYIIYHWKEFFTTSKNLRSLSQNKAHFGSDQLTKFVISAQKSMPTIQHFRRELWVPLWREDFGGHFGIENCRYGGRRTAARHRESAARPCAFTSHHFCMPTSAKLGSCSPSSFEFQDLVRFAVNWPEVEDRGTIVMESKKEKEI